MSQKQPNPPPVSRAGVLNALTKQQMDQAFEAWERGCRIHPERFRRPEEVACLGISQVSAERTDYLFELLMMEQASG